MNKENGVDANLVIDNLLNQIVQLSKDKAIASASATQSKNELDEIKSEKQSAEK